MSYCCPLETNHSSTQVKFSQIKRTYSQRHMKWSCNLQVKGLRTFPVFFLDPQAI